MAHDLNLPTIADGQADGQWQTSNDGDAALGNALNDFYTVDFSGGNVTLTSAQFRSAMTFIPSGLSATRSLTIPGVKRALFLVDNTDASDTINVVRGSTTIGVPAGQIGVFNTDGTTNSLNGAILVTGGAPGDVVGPASVTDGNPAIFDGTTGKLIKQRTFTQFTASLIAMVGDSGAGGTKGLVPAPGSGDAAAGKYLKADGTFAVPPGTAGSIGDGDKGDVTVSSSGTVWTVDVLQGASAGNILYYDGNSPAGWQKLAVGTSGQFLKTLGAAAPAWADLPCDVPMSFGGTPTAGQLMGKTVVVRDTAFAANFSGSSGHVGTNPAATFAIDVQDNGSSIGTISISTGGTFTFTTASGTAKTVSAGHRLEFYAPANSPAEASIANIAATLKGTAI